MLEKLTQQLGAARSLNDEEARQAVEQLADEKVPVAVKADFLTALAKKGETTGEIAAFARALRDKSISPPLDAEIRTREILDVVGTGGDRLSTFNISTTVALVAAAGGVLVAKHGNRASTSPIGSADVMEALGIPFDLGPEDAVRSLQRHNFAYFFAPKYHPAFRHIIPARKLCAERGQTTIFNFLGPLLNPARPTAVLVGVPRPDFANRLPASSSRSASAAPWWFAVKCGMKPVLFGISMNFRRWGRPRSPSFIRNMRWLVQRCHPNCFPCNRPRWPICAAETAK